LTIIKEERERWTVVCARSPVNSPGNPCHEEIAAIGTRLRSLNQINIGDSEGTKKMYVRRNSIMTKFALEGVRPLYERSLRDKTVVGIFYYFGIFDDLVLERTKEN